MNDDVKTGLFIASLCLFLINLSVNVSTVSYLSVYCAMPPRSLIIVFYLSLAMAVGAGFAMLYLLFGGRGEVVKTEA